MSLALIPTRSMTQTKSTVLTVTDLTLASYGLVGFAAVLAKAGRGEVFLVSTHRGRAESKPVTDERPSAPPPTAALRHEGQLLEQQRKWCADHGVRCRAELLEDAAWPELVIRSARRVRADLILLAAQFRGASGRIIPQEMQSLAQDAPCPVSLVRLPGLWAYKNHA